MKEKLVVKNWEVFEVGWVEIKVGGIEIHGEPKLHMIIKLKGRRWETIGWSGKRLIVRTPIVGGIKC